MGSTRVGPARCGSLDPEHRRRGCLACNAAYAREWRARGKSPDLVTCAICELTRRPDGTPVYQYALSRKVKIRGRTTTRAFASIALCDRCIREKARPSLSYMRAHGLTARSWSA